jgi:uncharacterized protein (TIGR03084 family)
MSEVPLEAVLNSLVEEQRSLLNLLDGLPSAAWFRDTPAAGWSVRDQVAHLADTEEVGYDTITDGPRAFRRALALHGTAPRFVEAGCRRADDLSDAELLGWWRSAASRTRVAWSAAPRLARVPWGLGMGLTDFARARLMEHWAHGLDIREALGVPVRTDDPAMDHVAVLGLLTVPYALFMARVRRPVGHTLRLELQTPRGTVTAGPPDATDVIQGPLYSWCRVAVQRDAAAHRRRLRPHGPLAELAIRHARAYL